MVIAYPSASAVPQPIAFALPKLFASAAPEPTAFVESMSFAFADLSSATTSRRGLPAAGATGAAGPAAACALVYYIAFALPKDASAAPVPIAYAEAP